MNIQQLWLNLPVKDMEKSKDFYRAIGMRENERHVGNPSMGSFFIDTKNTVLMLFPEKAMEGFMQNTIADTAKGNEVLFNIGAESAADVDAMAALVRAAGGTIYAEPGESQGWMYAFGFADPDGHRWSMLYMDMSKMGQ